MLKSSKSPFLYKGKPYSFREVAKRYDRVKRVVPKAIGDEVVRFSRARFAASAWTDTSAKRWAKRKDQGKKSKGRKLLVKSGRLRNSIRVIEANWKTIAVGSSLPYARAHNEGFNGTVQVRAHKRAITQKTKVYDTRSMNIRTRKHNSRTIKVRTGSTTVSAHTRKMNLPQRQFLGNSAHLTRKIDRIIIKEMDKIF